MDNTKTKLRNQIRLARCDMDHNEAVIKSNEIAERLLPYLKGYSNIASYCSIQNEVDVSSLLFLKRNFFLPKILNSERMEFFLFEGIDKLKVGPMNILEPAGTVMIDPEELDLMIIPLVAFDENCNRIGQGKGYYDRYLAKTNCLKIGVAYEYQKVNHIESDKFDIKLDMIITEKEIYKNNEKAVV